MCLNMASSLYSLPLSAHLAIRLRLRAINLKCTILKHIKCPESTPTYATAIPSPKSFIEFWVWSRTRIMCFNIVNLVSFCSVVTITYFLILCNRRVILNFTILKHTTAHLRISRPPQGPTPLGWFLPLAITLV